MKLTQDDIRKLATLSHMQLSEEEVQRFHKELNELFGTIAILEEVDTTNVPETFQVSGAVAEPRADKANYTFERSDMLASMPSSTEDGYMKVAAVLKQSTEDPEF